MIYKNNFFFPGLILSHYLHFYWTLLPTNISWPFIYSMMDGSYLAGDKCYFLMFSYFCKKRERERFTKKKKKRERERESFVRTRFSKKKKTKNVFFFFLMGDKKCFNSTYKDVFENFNVGLINRATNNWNHLLLEYPRNLL